MKRFLPVAGKAVLILCCCLWSGCGNADFSRTLSQQYTDTAMGTVIQQTLYTASEEEGQEFAGDVMDVLNDLEENLLSWREDTSEIYQINASAGREEGFPVSERLEDILRQCVSVYRDSAGAFDISMGSVVRLWNIDQWAAQEPDAVFRIPDSGALKKALALCGGEKIRLEEGEPCRIFLPEGMQLDLGAAGKGAALQELEHLLAGRPEIRGAVISLGGSILTYGSKPDGSPWKVGIINPIDTSSNAAVLSLEGCWYVSTSGDYERYGEADGVRYHHILDPETGYPADSGVRGVTVLSGDGVLSDCLSTACFILGPEKGMELAEKYGAEALFILEDGTILMTEGMEAYL